MTAYAISFVAGLLTIISPCVLPVLPIIIGASLSKHKLGPLLLALGMVLSFTFFGFFLAVFGQQLGIDDSHIRWMAIILMLSFGLILMFKPLQNSLTKLLSPLANKASSLTQSQYLSGVSGEFFIGALMGLVWSPCVGPTLGTAFTLAAQKQNLWHAFFTMLMFSIGSVIPILMIAYSSNSFFKKKQGVLMQAGERAKKILGATLILVALAMAFKWDKLLESQLLDMLPDAWLDLITRF